MLPESPLQTQMETQAIEEQRRAAERRADELHLYAEESAPVERRSHLLDPIRRLLRAIRRTAR
jgi:hypothetical protein